MEHVKKYIEENKDRFLDELFGLIRIPSISSESARKDDMLAAAEYWKESMLKAGADKAEVMPTDGNPVVYGEKIIDPSAPTVLVYGHYDVMPVDPIDLWKSDPFEPALGDRQVGDRDVAEAALEGRNELVPLHRDDQHRDLDWPSTDPLVEECFELNQRIVGCTALGGAIEEILAKGVND